MTSEIAILNKTAIALAADSAMSMGGENKVFQSSNKLFMLTKNYPIGIMVYGNARLNGVPWETIINVYRKEKGEIELKNSEEYLKKFLDFISEKITWFTEEEQNELVGIASYSFFIKLNKILEEYMIEYLEDNPTKSDKEILLATKEKLESDIKLIYDKFKESEYCEGIDDNRFNELLNLYDKLLNVPLDEVFSQIKLTKSYRDKLKQIAIGFFCKKDLKNDFSSGIVIAGFGSNEIYPSLISIEINGILDNQIIYFITNNSKISNEKTASIIPFAQIEIIETFIEGVHPDYKQWIHDYIEGIYLEYPTQIVEKIPNIDSKQKSNLIKKFKSEGLKEYDIFLEEEKENIENYYSPMLDVVEILPKDEMAIMAETLINITMFKRKISKDLETVGGPIDIAVISKGEGFIWFKRKHYFKPDLNPNYMKQYYKN